MVPRSGRSVPVKGSTRAHSQSQRPWYFVSSTCTTSSQPTVRVQLSDWLEMLRLTRMWKESPEASTPSARSLLRRWKAGGLGSGEGRGGGDGYFLRVCSGVTRLDATPTVIVGSVVQLDGSRAVLQHPVGFFLSAGLQCDALALAADASLDLFSQSQRRHK